MQHIQKKIPMSNASPTSDLFFPDSDIGRLSESIRSLYVAILNRALKDIFEPAHSDHEIYRNQALYWIAVDDFESINSFVNICNHLDINVDEFRHILNVELGRIERGLPHRIKFSMNSH